MSAAVNTKTDKLKIKSFYNMADEKEQPKKYLTFKVADILLALHIEEVIEILTLQDITYIPCLPDYSKGVTNIRGKIVPVIDLRERFAKPECEYTDRACIIVTGTDDDMFGYITEWVENIEEALESDVMESPIYDNGLSSFTSSIIKTASGFALLINLEALTDSSISISAGT